MSGNTGDERGPRQARGTGLAAAIRRAAAGWPGTRREPGGGSR
jgi:hypothetical protein